MKVGILIMVAFAVPALYAQDARDIVERANEKINGEKSSYSLMAMTIIRPEWERTLEFKAWTLGTDYALTLITSPARDRGQAYLKRASEMWNWNPGISRMIKLPPAMMSQGWMGSDYTNDDILKESSVVEDYNHEIIAEEELEGRQCYKIRLTAKEGATVIWGQQLRWISKDNDLFLKAELYDEEGYLVRTELGREIKTMDGRLIPTVMEIIPEDEEGYKTIIEIKEIKFNITVEDGFFSQQNLQRSGRLINKKY
ncbi:MAG: outer membrane lipoprotein-sorting protein, partial [Bacteroidales bacterium]|nr:outer membrane lipoprotein-sorting protein [Bacteroidales bacterium]